MCDGQISTIDQGNYRKDKSFSQRCVLCEHYIFLFAFIQSFWMFLKLGYESAGTVALSINFSAVILSVLTTVCIVYKDILIQRNKEAMAHEGETVSSAVYSTPRNYALPLSPSLYPHN